MKIAIITPGMLPVPATRGGAVETLIEYLINHNEEFLSHQITVYGTTDTGLLDKHLKKYKKTNFLLIDQSSLRAKIKRTIFRIRNRDLYYHYHWEYYITEVCKLITLLTYDIVVVENRPGFILTLMKYTKARLVLHLHNDTLDKNTKDALRILESCSAILTVSNYLKQKVRSILPENKIHLVYNGIDLDAFSTLKVNNIKREKLGLKDSDFIVVFTGRIEPIKGIRELIEAHFLLSAYEDIKFLIIGGSSDGSHHESKFLQEMHSLASTVSNQILFLGFQPYKKIPSLLNLCDIAVIPSICEDALTMTSLEDMASGLPLIVTRSGGIPEAVNEASAIILEKDVNLVRNLAEAILSLYKNKDKRKQMAVHAKERSKQFSKEKYASNFFSIVKKVSTT